MEHHQAADCRGQERRAPHRAQPQNDPQRDLLCESERVPVEHVAQGFSAQVHGFRFLCGLAQEWPVGRTQPSLEAEGACCRSSQALSECGHPRQPERQRRRRDRVPGETECQTKSRDSITSHVPHSEAHDASTRSFSTRRFSMINSCRAGVFFPMKNESSSSLL